MTQGSAKLDHQNSREGAPWGFGLIPREDHGIVTKLYRGLVSLSAKNDNNDTIDIDFNFKQPWCKQTVGICQPFQLLASQNKPYRERLQARPPDLARCFPKTRSVPTSPPGARQHHGPKGSDLENKEVEVKKTRFNRYCRTMSFGCAVCMIYNITVASFAAV